MIRDSVLGLSLNVIGCACEAGKRGQLGEECVDRVADVVVQRWFAFFGKPAGE
jgi:hypothetical protein